MTLWAGLLPFFNAVLTLLGISRLIEDLESVCINFTQQLAVISTGLSSVDVLGRTGILRQLWLLRECGATLVRTGVAFQGSHAPPYSSPYARGKGEWGGYGPLWAPDRAILLYYRGAVA